MSLLSAPELDIGQIINQGGPTNAQYASLWSQVAAKYAGNSKIIFGIMNEPHDVQITPWVSSVQAGMSISIVMSGICES
jgi:aryl-phospho-beta-D-glucosidase BglC (GH1 family)